MPTLLITSPIPLSPAAHRTPIAPTRRRLSVGVRSAPWGRCRSGGLAIPGDVMSNDEARMQLHEEARRALVDVAADVLMNALPADPEALATSSHVTDVGAEVRAEIDRKSTRLNSSH